MRAEPFGQSGRRLGRSAGYNLRRRMNCRDSRKARWTAAMHSRRGFLGRVGVGCAAVAAVPGESDAAAKFFHLEQRNGKWWMIDPAGKPFHMRGCNHYGTGSVQWRETLRDRHRDWGFTYLPPSVGGVDHGSDGAGAKTRGVSTSPEWPAEDFVALNYPFAAFLAGGMKRAGAGGRDPFNFQALKSADMPDVFGTEFAEALDGRCREFVAPLRDNRQLIGYHFCHNPPWNMDAPTAEDWITACTQPVSAGLKEWTRLMQRLYGSIERWRETYGIPIKQWSDIEQIKQPLNGYVSKPRARLDREAFLVRICEQWHRMYHDAIRKYDPNHLILGDRNTLHLQPAPAPWAFHIMRRFLDVLSVNVMGPPRTVYGVLEAATRHWDGPILLADTGAAIYAGEPPKQGYQARDLAEWEEVYGGMMRMSVEHPQIIGFGWCSWYEMPQGRVGIVDSATEAPIADRVAVVKKWNAWMAGKLPLGGKGS
ncbi:MAG: twin-arginine translocation signal domain-containing protein [Acidobacteria bacterium]|nr:twin-arginine translocation signal domain-containing protein [Acidobacteriota bacterium]